MSRTTRKMRRELESRFGVDAEFAGHMSPVLEQFEASLSSPEERDRLLHSLAAAYRSSRRHPAADGGEVRVLLEDVETELRKVDESLKVLSVYLLRLCRRMEPSGRDPAVH